MRCMLASQVGLAIGWRIALRPFNILARIPGSMAACRGKVLASAAAAELFAAATSMPSAVASGKWAAMLGTAGVLGTTKGLASGSASGVLAGQELLGRGHGC